jgi:hypothetical protein
MRGRDVTRFVAVWLAAWLVAPLTSAAQEVDLRAAEAAIMQADRDFNRAVADGSRERFTAMIAGTAGSTAALPTRRGAGTPFSSHGRRFSKRADRG